MDFDLSFIVILFSLTFILAFIKATILSKPNLGLSPNPNPKLPPGPTKLPLIGNLHQLFIDCQLPHQKLSNLALKYGPMMHLQLGEISTIVVSSPEAAKEVLKTHDMAFANRSTLLAGGIIYYNNTDIGFSPYGEYWRHLRKICTMELLSTRRVKSFKGLRQEEFSDMCKWIASKEGTVIDLSEKLEFTICDVVTKATLGNNIEKLATFISITKETAELISGFQIADFYPSSKLLQLVNKVKSRAERLHKISDRILQTVINDHMLENNDESKQREDLVDVLLKFNKPGHGFYLTVENIKAILMDIFTAGIETSSTTLNWAMAEILKHPRVLKKAQDEVRRVFGDKGFVDESSLEELTYLKLIVKETLRMHPPVPLLLPRVSGERCDIHGYEVPLNTRVIVNVSAIGRDPRYCNEADSFIPERFVDNDSVDFLAKSFDYIPFGGGRRICPGISFGVANVEVPLAMLLYHFDWVLPDGIDPETLDMTEMHGVSVRRKNSLCVIPTTKIPLPV